MNIAFFGSSLVSAYWNGACTYYRGIVRALAERGHSISFFEPDALDRQGHRDIADPEWAEVIVYPAEDRSQALDAVKRARGADVVVKASGVGVFDDVLERAVLDIHADQSLLLFWDVDAPATLAAMERDPRNHLRGILPGFDVVLTYGGGDPVVSRYAALGASTCIPIYNALDPTTHHPVEPDERFAADLSFLGNRLPDREARVDSFFFAAARAAGDRRFLLGGAGWDPRELPANVAYVGHISPSDHNAFNCSSVAVLNVSRSSMATNGFSPATRVFEAAGAGACLITDAWEGIELFLEPGEEVLVAEDGEEVAAHLRSLDRDRARAIGHSARTRVTSEHMYAHRALQVEEILDRLVGGAA